MTHLSSPAFFMPPRRALPAFAALSLVILLSVFLSNGGHAQSRVLGAATLTDNVETIALGPYAIVQKDPARNITPESIRASGGSILSGKMSRSDNIFLGYDGTPTWISIKLANDSSNSQWFLDLGRRMEGRLGHIRAVRAYEFSPATSTQNLQLRELPAYGKKGLFKINMASGAQELILLEVVPTSGISAVLPLKLMSERALLGLMQQRETTKTSFCLALGGFALFFLMKAAALRKAGVALYGAYFIYAAALWLVYNSLGAVTGKSIFDELLVTLILGYSLMSIFMVKTFCGIGQSSYTERYVIIGLAWLNVTSTILSFFLPAGNGGTHAGLLYGPPVLTLAVLSVMSYAQAKNMQIPGYAFCVSWLMPLFGMMLTIMAACSFSPEHFPLLNAFWYMLFIQGLFLSIAVHQKYLMPDAEEKGFLSHARLKEAKETADYAQLLKVIETERKILAEFRQQEALRTAEMKRAKEAADEANRAKSAFLAVVSHEIRTPMTGVMGMVKLLLDSSLSKQQKDYVLTVQESADAMLSLLNDILDFEKIQRGKMELEEISFDLHRLIQGVVNLMSGHAAQKSISLSARMGDDTPRYVKGDPTRLRQILLNLMGNAIKFTTVGSVTLIVKSLDNRTDHEDFKNQNSHTVYFAVQDTGIGIPADAQKNLFNPFTQVDSSVNRRFGGTGLGLAISKGLVDAMGSTININSQANEGSTFFFTLDMKRGLAAAPEQAKKEDSETPPRPVRPMKILVVDDNHINCKVVSSFLERDGHAVTILHDAVSALKAVDREDFDAVLMDIELPGMRGNEAARRIREHDDRQKAKTPVIAMTGNVSKEDVERYLADGMDTFLGKPIDPDRLGAILADVAAKTLEREIRAPGISRPTSQPLPQSGDFSLSDMHVDLQLDDDDGQHEHALPASTVPDHKPAASVKRTVFNASMLSSLKDTIGQDELNQLLDELIAKTDDILSAMRGAVEAGDIKEISARAHELKGMAGNFGLVEMSELAAVTERHARANEMQDIRFLFGSFADANRRAQDALRQWSS